MNSRPTAAATPDQLARRRRTAGRAAPRSLPAPAGSAAVGPPAGAQRLDHEQRVALGLGEQRVGVDARRRGEPLGEHGGLRAATTGRARSRSRARAPAAPRRARAAGARVELLARAPSRRPAAAPPAGCAAGSAGTAASRGRPVQVVGDQQQRRGRAEQRAGDRVEQPLALLALGQAAAGVCASSGSRRASSVRWPRSSRRRRAASGPARSQATTGPYASAPSAAYERASAVARAAWAHHARSSSTSRVLPMPGSPRHQHELRAPALGRAPQLGQPRPLGRPADEHGAPGGAAPAAAAAAAPRTRSRVAADGSTPSSRSSVAAQRGRPAAPAPGRRARRAGASAAGTSPRAAGRGAAAARRSAIAPARRRPAPPAAPASRSSAARWRSRSRSRSRAATRRSSRRAGRRAYSGDRASSRDQVGVVPRVERRLERRRRRARTARPAAIAASAAVTSRKRSASGQRAPQLVQHVPQVRPRLRLGGVRPQQEREPLPRLRRVAVEQQVGEQRLGARRLERRQGTLAEPELQLAEQPDAEPCRVHGPVSGPAAAGSTRTCSGRRPWRSRRAAGRAAPCRAS